MLVCVPEEVLMQYSPVLNSSPVSKIRIFYLPAVKRYGQVKVQFSKFDFINKSKSFGSTSLLVVCKTLLYSF